MVTKVRLHGTPSSRFQAAAERGRRERIRLAVWAVGVGTVATAVVLWLWSIL